MLEMFGRGKVLGECCRHPNSCRRSRDRNVSSRVVLNICASPAASSLSVPGIAPLLLANFSRTSASNGSSWRRSPIIDGRTKCDRFGSSALASNFAHSSFRTSRSSSIAAVMSGIATDGLASSRFLTPRSRKICSVRSHRRAQARMRLCASQSPTNQPTRSRGTLLMTEST